MSDEKELKLTITGEVLVLGDTQAFGAKGFRKTECVIRTNGEYRQSIPVEACGKQADIFTEQNVCVGDTVRVQCDLQGREWNGRYFMSVKCWRVEVIKHGTQQEAVIPDSLPDIPACADDDLDAEVPF